METRRKLWQLLGRAQAQRKFQHGKEATQALQYKERSFQYPWLTIAGAWFY